MIEAAKWVIKDVFPTWIENFYSIELFLVLRNKNFVDILVFISAI